MQNYKRLFGAGVLALMLMSLVMFAAGQASARETGGTVMNALPNSGSFGEPGQFLTGANEGEPLDIALNYLRQNAEALGLNEADLADLAVTDQYTSKHNGVTHIYLRQQVNGLEVFGSSLNINIASDGSVINVGNRAVANLAEAANGSSPNLTAEAAVFAAADQLGLAVTEQLVVEESLNRADRKVTFSNGGVSLEAIPARLVYQPTEKFGLRLSWDLSIYELSADNWWSVRIDAETGSLLSQDNWVIHEDFLAQAAEAGVLAQGGDNGAVEQAAPAPNRGEWIASPDSYKVYTLPVEAPHFTTPLPPSDGRVNVVDPANGASPFGWHDTDGIAGAESEYTIGNNADAYEDTNNSNSPSGGDGSRAFGGPTLDFDHPINLAGAPSTYIPASVTNLFYWTNIIHDVTFNYGFDEVAGNFQENNYGNGGLGSDYVYAEGQDGGGNCNANFGTPADGNNPRMQMYTCTNASPARDGDLDNGVIAHEYGHGISNRLTGGPAASGCLSNLEQMGEGWSDYIALMLTQRTGDMGPDARAIGTYLFGQGPNGAGIRPTPYSTNLAINPTTYGDIGGLAIPHGVGYAWATMLWEVNWNLIDAHGFNPDIYEDWTTGGNNLAFQLVMDGMKLQPCNPGFVDGRDGILAADMALTGGANQCAIWDGFAKRGLGFSADQGSSNSVNDGVEAFDTHPACAYIGVELDETQLDICTGDTALYDVIVGINYTPNVTLSADGHPAGTSASFSPNPVTSVPDISTLTIGSTGAAAPGDYTITITGTDSSTSAQTTVDLTVYDAVPAVVNLTAPANGANNVSVKPTFSWSGSGTATSYYIEVDDNSDFSSPVVTGTVSGTSFTPSSFLDHETVYYWRVTANNACGDSAASATWDFTTEILAGTCSPGVTTNVAFSDDLEGGAPGWTHLSNPDTNNTGLDTWTLSSARTSSGVNAWYAQDTESKTDQLLVSPAVSLPGVEESPITLFFSNYQHFEDPNSNGTCWDAGILEISTDGGTNWDQVPNSAMLTDPYDSTIWNNTPGNNPITEDYGATQAWCPNPPPQDWLISAVDLDAYAGQTVNFRWRIGTDSAAGNEGWYIDDIAVQSCEPSEPEVSPTLYLPSIHKAESSSANGTAALPFSGLVLLPAMVGLGFFSYWRSKREL